MIPFKEAAGILATHISKGEDERSYPDGRGMGKLPEEERAKRQREAKSRHKKKASAKALAKAAMAKRMEDPEYKARANEQQKLRKQAERSRPEARAVRNAYEVARQRADRKVNPEKYKAYNLASARNAGTGGWPVEVGSACALCGIQDSVPGAGLVIDHDHATGKLRNPLCKRCNMNLGRLERDTEWTYRAVEYIDRSWSAARWRRGMTPTHRVACEMCWVTDAPGRQNRLVQDHCHATRTIRGVLCGGCNKSLGLVEQDRAWTSRSLAYIERHRANQ